MKIDADILEIRRELHVDCKIEVREKCDLTSHAHQLIWRLVFHSVWFQIGRPIDKHVIQTNSL